MNSSEWARAADALERRAAAEARLKEQKAAERREAEERRRAEIEQQRAVYKAMIARSEREGEILDRFLDSPDGAAAKRLIGLASSGRGIRFGNNIDGDYSSSVWLLAEGFVAFGTRNYQRPSTFCSTMTSVTSGRPFWIG